MVQQQKEIIALQQFKQLLIDDKSRSPNSASDDIYFCGVRLQLDAIDDRTDVILLKFLRDKDFEVEDAFKMFSRAIVWRKKFGIDKLQLEDEDDKYSNTLARAFFTSRRSREGHPVWYIVCGAFLDKELYDEAFSDEAKKERFLKWRIMFIERTMRKLDFRAGGISSIIVVMDADNSSGLDKTALEVFKSTNRLLYTYYPKFVETRIMINVSWLGMTLMRIRSSFSAKRRNDKVVFAGRSESRDILLRYVGEEQIPTRCQGLTKRDGEFEAWDGEIEAWDAATEVILKRATKHNIVAEVGQSVAMVQQQKEIIALQQFKQLLIDKKRSCSPDSASEEIYFCGVRLQLDAIDDRTDVILLKFLRAKDFEVEDAFKMFSRAILWRKKFGINELHLKDEDDEDSNTFRRVLFLSGRSREGHPVWYMMCGAFQDMELYDEAFSDEAKKQRFLKWRIMFIERIMRKLDFRATGLSSTILVMDFKNISGIEKTAFKAFESALRSLLNYYPEFVERRILINMSWWDLTYTRIRSPFFPQCSVGKLFYAGPSMASDILSRYVGEEEIPKICESPRKRDGEFEVYRPIPMALQQKEVIALQQFKQLLIDLKKSESHDPAKGEVYINMYGVRLELDTIDERTDVILLKFLRAKDFEVQDAFKMLYRATQWRRKFGINKLRLKVEDDEDSNSFGRVFFMSGRSRGGYPVWYMACGAFQDKELYDAAFSDEAKKERFLKWRIMFIEKTMRKLDFRAGGISSTILVMDMKNVVGLEHTAVEAFESTIRLLLNYYPEFVERRILINVPWWDLTCLGIEGPFMAQCKNDKVLFARPSKSSDILSRYVGEEEIPKRCESLRKRDCEFEAWDVATELILKRATKHSIVAEVNFILCVIGFDDFS
ncbi:PATL5 [Linum grandiflorum]